MKKTFLIFGVVALMATFNSCGNCETNEGDVPATDTTEVVANDVNEEEVVADTTQVTPDTTQVTPDTTVTEESKCGEGKCGDGK